MFLVFLLINISIPILVIIYFYLQMERPPKIRPATFRKQDEKLVVVLAGDSITHGRIGENYVNIVSEQLGPEYDVINAGVNSQLAWNLFQRLNEIVRCEPDIITIMIGTNDANAATSRAEAEFYMKKMKLPKLPDREGFREHLTSIVEYLVQQTTARIALLSIPPIGEDPEHPAYLVSKEYSEIIEEVARRTDTAYLPLHERMNEVLLHEPGNPCYPFEKLMWGMIKALIKRYFMKRRWNDIGEDSGFRLHIDYLHLNTRGAQIVVDLIKPFVKGF